MRKFIILMSICGIFSTACNDKDPVKPVDAATLSRVKSITGHDPHWGNYVMSMHYGDDSNIDSIVIRNDADKRIGHVSVSEGENTLSYIFTDIIDDGGQSESVVRTYRTIVVEYWRGNVQSQTFTTYRPEENTGDAQDNSYIPDSRLRYIYEYDGEERISICRKIEDIYDNEEGDDYYVRNISKTEIAFDGGRVGTMHLYRSDGNLETEENYVETDKYTFNYTSAKLSSISGAKLQMSYTYSGALPSSIVTNGSSVGYQHNADGLVTRITYSDSEYADITYEQGSGSLRLMSPLFDELFGIPAMR